MLGFWTLPLLSLPTAAGFGIWNAKLRSRCDSKLSEGAELLKSAKYQQAVAAFEQAFSAASRMTMGQGDRLIWCAMYSAEALQKAGQKESAYQAATSALMMSGNQVEADYSFQLYTMLADLSDENAYPHRAIGMRQIVVALLRRTGIPNSLPLAEHVAKLGASLARVGLPEHAVKAMAEAVEITGHRLPESNHAHAEYLVQLASLLSKVGTTEGAEAALERALVIQRALFGEKDQRLVPALSELGSLFCDWTRYNEAFACFEEAYQIQMRAGGPSDAKVGLILASYADCLRKAGRLGPAEDAAERAVKLLEMNLHPSLASSLGTLGTVLLAEGNYSQAVDAFERAGAAAVFSEGSINPLDTAERLDSHAEALEHLHRVLDAEHLRSGASSIRSTLAAIPPAEELYTAQLEHLLHSTEWPPTK